MLFCGQCGMKLSAGDTRCPRCGAPVESGASIENDAKPDAPTVASPSLPGNIQTPISANPNNVGDPQKLVLRPDRDAGSSNYGTQAAYEDTRRMEVQEQGYTSIPGAPANPAMDPSYPADHQAQYSQNSGNYLPQDIYAGYVQSGSNYASSGTPYSSPSQQGYQPYPAQERRTSANARGRTAALLIVLLGLFLILAAMTLFILARNNVFGNSNRGNSGIVAGTPISIYYVVGSQNGFGQRLHGVLKPPIK